MGQLGTSLRLLVFVVLIALVVTTVFWFLGVRRVSSELIYPGVVSDFQKDINFLRRSETVEFTIKDFQYSLTALVTAHLNKMKELGWQANEDERYRIIEKRYAIDGTRRSSRIRVEIWRTNWPEVAVKIVISPIR